MKLTAYWSQAAYMLLGLLVGLHFAVDFERLLESKLTGRAGAVSASGGTRGSTGSSSRKATSVSLMPGDAGATPAQLKSWFDSLRGRVAGRFPHQESQQVWLYEMPTEPPFVKVDINPLDPARPLHDPHVGYTSHHILRRVCAQFGTSIRAIDVGGGLGHFAAQYAALGCSAIAIEPREFVNAYINLTKIANGWSDDRLLVFERLVGDETRLVTTYNNFLRFSFTPQPADTHGEWLPRVLQMDTISNMNAAAGLRKTPCYFTKVDVDGFEVRVLKGMQKTGLFCVHYIVEFTPADWPLSGTTHEEAAEVLQELEAKGYAFKDTNWGVADSMWNHDNPYGTGWYDSLPEDLWVETSVAGLLHNFRHGSHKSEVWIYKKGQENADPPV